jgi:hypothetical protein
LETNFNKTEINRISFDEEHIEKLNTLNLENILSLDVNTSKLMLELGTLMQVYI